jgi:outer membrane protein
MRSTLAPFISALLLLAASSPLPALAEAQPLSLAEALRIARAQSPVLKRASAQAAAADARADGSRARLLPQVTSSANYQRTTDNPVQRPGFGVLRPQPRYLNGTTNGVDSFVFQIVANQVVFDFGVTTETLKADRETARAQADSARAALLDTEYQVRNAFFLARAQRALIHVAEHTLANQQKHLAQIDAFVEVGTRPEIDLAQARTDVANARVQLLSAQNAYAAAKQNLKLLLGADPAADYEVNDDTLEPLHEEDAALDPLFELARAERPEFGAATRLLRAQALRTRAAKGRFGPALSATAAMSEQGIDLRRLTWNAFAGATLSWPLIEGGAVVAAVHESEANQRALEADLLALEQRVRVQLEQARLALQAAKASLSAAADAQEAARARLQLAEGRYEAGVGNAIELGDAQLALTAADAQRVQFEYNLASARAQLLGALGKVQ